ncbi:MAG TPA: alpha-glucan family phosphorylase [Ilumatobacteraceae bacterium]
MRPVHSFRIEPTLPARFTDLRRVAGNLRWTWDERALALFADLDPAAWDKSDHDPIRLLELITPERWAVLADDGRIADEIDAVVRQLDDATAASRWFQHRDGSPLELVAYFSPEFGLSETLAQYSGGLGILAGDHLKAAADLGVPLVGIGLLYRQGYFHQRLDPDGWQNEAFPPQDPNGLAMTPTGLQISLEVGGEHVAVAIWRVDVGRIPLYLLDTGLPANSPQAAGITDRLYGGDVEHRLRQEIVLGIGGVRALRALGLHPQVFHTNEGHAGFLSLERIREHIAGGLSYAEAVEAVRAGGVFTTHTPVPAGIDRFPPELMQKYFGGFATQCGITLDELLAIGRRADEPDEHRFNMAVMGLRLAARSNGVAALHGEVSRHMFRGLWPDVPVDEVPIGSITNGVHAHTWVAPRISSIFSSGIHPVWDGADASTWDAARKLDDATIWAARNQGRSEMVSFVRERLGDDLLDPDALTIGFSRRFATYKRATLLLAQADRLISILHGRDRPVQFVFAGKAHPADQPGKEMIREIELFGRRSDVRGRFVFVPDYDMAIARKLYHGADVWLNNPRRPLEACGTSGMKAALNGALNCSILDGWWDEAYDGMNGWAIDSAEEEPDIARRDEREAASLFGLLEQEIVPLFYDRRDGIPVRWLERVKHGWATIGPVFTASRMVRQYTTALYEPAAAAAGRMHTEDGAAAKALAAWKRHVVAHWNGVAVIDVSGTDTPPSPAGAGAESGVGAGAGRGDGHCSVSATVRLGALTPSDVTVQVVHGPVDADGAFSSSTTAPLERAEQLADGSLRYAGSYVPTAAGMYGCTVRVLPNHPDLTTPMELGRIAWA